MSSSSLATRSTKALLRTVHDGDLNISKLFLQMEQKQTSQILLKVFFYFFFPTKKEKLLQKKKKIL